PGALDQRDPEAGADGHDQGSPRAALAASPRRASDAARDRHRRPRRRGDLVVRPGLLPDNMLEQVAMRMNLGPVPDGHAMFGMPMSRVTIAGVRMGVFKRLAGGPAAAEQVAHDIGANVEGVMLLLESLAVLDQVERRRGIYSLSRAGRKWLDPASETYVGTHIENCLDYWEWWDRLEDAIRTGDGVDIHDFPPNDPHWRRYIRGQFELARLSAREVAGALRLPAGARRVLDVAGGHGWFAAELCRRHL